MNTSVREKSKEIFYATCKNIGFSSLGILLQQQNVQILAYHGICDKEYTTGKYIPSYFVYRERFREQMNFLKEKMNPISLLDAIELIQAKHKIPLRTIVVTFDDGYLNNLTDAVPILDEFKIPATIFLATGYVKKGGLFPFDKYRLLLAWAAQKRLGNVQIKNLLHEIPTFASSSLSAFVKALNYYWGRFEHLLDKRQIELLRPMDLFSIKKINYSKVSFGAHTENHVILNNEDSLTRKNEIVESVKFIKGALGFSKIAFSYPVGEKECFNEQDKKIVQETGCCCAVTCLAGSNSHKQDLFSLMRRSISLNHDLDAFLAELAGIRQRIITRAI